jgi:hypothetical protein
MWYAFHVIMESDGEALRMGSASFVVPGPVAATRQRGEAVREQLVALLNTTNAMSVEVDFSAVEAMTVSFADELVGKLLGSRANGSWSSQGIAFAGTTDDVRETIEAVVVRRNLVAIYRDAGADRVLTLGAPKWFDPTLQLAKGLHTFRAADLAKKLGVTPQAANHRLQQLLASGAVTRMRVSPPAGGKEFEYQVV